jgi:ATP-binding cassette subfamily B protein
LSIRIRQTETIHKPLLTGNRRPATSKNDTSTRSRKPDTARKSPAVRLIKPYLLENRYKILIGLLSLIITDVLQLIIPRIIKRAVDELTAFEADTRLLLYCALSMVGIALFIGVFRYIWRRCLLGTSRRVEEGLRNQLFDHLQRLSAAYFDRAKTGDLMAHATNDIQQIRMAVGMGMVALNDAIVLGMAAIAFMAYINVKLTAFVLIPMPLIVISTRFFSKQMHRRYQDVQAAFSALTEVVRERFAGIRIIKAHHRKSQEAQKIKDVSNEYVRKNIRLVKIIGAFFPIMLLFTNLSLAIVLYLGGRQTILQIITPGDFVAFLSYLGLLTWPMMALGWVTNLIQRGRASLDRISRILNTAPDIQDRADARSLSGFEGRIKFENVSFSYETEEEEPQVRALDQIDLSLEPSRVLGIVGPPGSGKSTLVALIPRLYDPQIGRILLDGQDIRTLKLNDLRSNIALIPQEPFLFAGTIRDNITFGNEHITENQLVAAVRTASLSNTIESFPDGYDTIVGEKGVLLSGGQKQRIALARCLLQDAPLLILDDPISQVDPETGTRIITGLKRLAGQKTIVIVSHRLSALVHADRIIALDQGRMIESGTHHQLMEADGYYARTYRLQEMEEELDAV